MKYAVRPLEILGLAASCAALELLFASYFTLGLYLDVVLVVCMYLAWRVSPQSAILCGTVFGLLQDMTLLAPYFGLSGLSKTVVMFVAVQARPWVSLDSSASRFLVIGAASVLDGLVIFTVLAVFGDQSALLGWIRFPVMAIVTGAGGALFWYAYDRVKVPPKDYRQIV